MTYIEFIDPCAIEDVCAVLTLPSDRVILVGKTKEVLDHRVVRYKRLMESRGESTEFLTKQICTDSLLEAVREIDELVMSEDRLGHECVIDLTGGGDLFLTAVGIVYGRLSAKGIKINLVRFDILKKAVIDGDGDGLPVFPEISGITVEEGVAIYGGKVIFDSEKKGTTHTWTVDRQLKGDVPRLWDICRKNPSLWNRQTALLGLAESREALRYKRQNVVECNPTRLAQISKQVISEEFLKRLVDGGFIKEYLLTEDTLRLVYRDEQVKKYITKSGQLLELATYLAVLGIKDREGKPLYNDVLTGVTIDWDGKLVERDDFDYRTPWYLKTKKDTKNEIDVLAMRGMVPVFISCKNGGVEMEELYKLETVANRFGGRYAVKILVATSLNKRSEATHTLLARAKEMNIRVLHENVKSNNFTQFQKRLRDVIESCFRKN